VSDRDELLAIARQAKEHLAWLERGGVVGLPRSQAPNLTPAPARAHAPTEAQPRPPSSLTLQSIRDELGDCQRCKLAPKRTNIVYGVGDPDAPLVFVGEAPGSDEDRTGEPFVGAAGQLLTKMIEAMGLGRQDVYICNILKCRPPGNRNPEPDEIAECEPFLKKQLAAIRPRMIVTLGKFAAQCLLRSDAPISKLRGAWKAYEGIPLMPTYHPAFLLRTPSAKREVWADLQEVMRELDRLGITRAQK
jgi:uracil-DNA glycosylase family 4